MPGIRKCKICGREYEYCRTLRSNTIFRWQDVACCVEHGTEYFAKVAASRGESSSAAIAEPEIRNSPKANPEVAEVIVNDVEAEIEVEDNSSDELDSFEIAESFNNEPAEETEEDSDSLSFLRFNNKKKK